MIIKSNSQLKMLLQFPKYLSNWLFRMCPFKFSIKTKNVQPGILSLPWRRAPVIVPPPLKISPGAAIALTDGAETHTDTFTLIQKHQPSKQTARLTNRWTDRQTENKSHARTRRKQFCAHKVYLSVNTPTLWFYICIARVKIQFYFNIYCIHIIIHCIGNISYEY